MDFSGGPCQAFPNTKSLLCRYIGILIMRLQRFRRLPPHWKQNVQELLMPQYLPHPDLFQDHFIPHNTVQNTNHRWNRNSGLLWSGLDCGSTYQCIQCKETMCSMNGSCKKVQFASMYTRGEETTQNLLVCWHEVGVATLCLSYMFRLHTEATWGYHSTLCGVRGHEPSKETLDGDTTRSFLPCSSSCGYPL